MKTKHTKGNWDYSTSLGEISITGTSCAIALVNTGTSINYNEARANAKLIAAAPELLDACFKARHHLRGGSTTILEALSLLDTVIKKATE